jgi:putative FmdB family regulatory protein
MPLYDFECRSCKKKFESLCSFDEIGTVTCPTCGADKPERLLSCPGAIIFKQPKGTSKENNFDYVAKWNMENAKDLRRKAEQESHMGSSPYNDIDDISSGEYFGEVK